MKKFMKKYFKKISCAFLCTAFTLSCAGVSAADSINASVIDPSADKVRVSVDAESGQKVFLTVYYPGYDNSSLDYDDYAYVSSVLAYANSSIADADGVSFDFVIRETDGLSGGGIFKIVATVDGVKLPEENFEFYFTGAKEDIIEDINDDDGTNMATLLESAVQIYGLNESELWNDESKAEILTALNKMKLATEEDEFSLDVNDFANILEDAMIVGNINSDNTDVLISDGVLTDYVLGMADEEVSEDYLNSLSADGIEEFNGEFFSDTYDTPADVEDAMRELMAFYTIKYYKDDGYGHVEEFLDRYEDVYEGNDFDLDDIHKVKNKNKFYSTFLNKSADNLSQLKRNFNSVLSDMIGGNGGGSSSGGTVTSGNDYPVVPVVPPTPPQTGFADMADASWANTAVNTLKDKNIISGYEDNTFKPKQNITRAEFAQLILNLAESTEFALENGNVTFSDVGVNDWFASAVSKAAASGIVNGKSEGFFFPLDQITREDAAVMIYRLLSKKVEFTDKTEFSDASSISEYAKDSISYLAGAKIVNGMGGNAYNPKALITRAEAAQLIFNAYNALMGGAK